MGLNVYFCDVCGVRVTDVDLRSGHGMLRGHAVICATCLEMGHGKEWLAARGGEAAQVGAALNLKPRERGVQGGRTGNAQLLDYARDRAATVEDRHNQENVADEEDEEDEEGSDTGIAHDPVQRHHEPQDEPLDEPQAHQLDHEDTGLVNPIPADFSGAAAGFAALSQSPARKESDDAHGDVDEDASDVVDPALLHVTPPSELSPNSDEQTSPFSAASAQDDDSSALISVNKSSRSASRSSASNKKGSNDNSRKSASRVGPSSNRIPSSSSSSSIKKTSSNSTVSPSKSGSGKISKSKTSRSSRGKAISMPSHFKIALITVPLILLIAVVVVLGRGSGSAKQADVKDLKAQQSQISRNFAEAERLVNDAWLSKDVAQMKAADTRWKQFMHEWDQFSSDTKKYSGWTEENCGDYWEGMHAPDVYNRTRLLRDEIAKQTKH